MNNLLILIPISPGLVLLGLTAFFWSLNSDQYNGLEGAARPILDNDYPPQDEA